MQAARRAAPRQGPAAMAAMAAVLRRPGGRFRWRTQVPTGGVRSATRDAAGRAGPGRGCTRWDGPAGNSVGWDRSPLASSHLQSPFQMEKQLGDPAGGSSGSSDLCSLPATPSPILTIVLTMMMAHLLKVPRAIPYTPQWPHLANDPHKPLAAAPSKCSVRARAGNQ